VLKPIFLVFYPAEHIFYGFLETQKVNASISFIGNSHFNSGGLERESNNVYHRQAATVSGFFSSLSFIPLHDSTCN